MLEHTSDPEKKVKHDTLKDLYSVVFVTINHIKAIYHVIWLHVNTNKDLNEAVRTIIVHQSIKRPLCISRQQQTHKKVRNQSILKSLRVG